MTQDQLLYEVLNAVRNDPAFGIRILRSILMEGPAVSIPESTTHEGMNLGEWYLSKGLDRECSNLLGRLGIKPEQLILMSDEQLRGKNGVGTSRLIRISAFRDRIKRDPS